MVLFLGMLSGIISGCGRFLVNLQAFFPEPGVQIDPRDFPIPIDTVSIQTRDGVRISGFALPNKNATRGILFLHGNAGNASHRLSEAAQLWASGANVLLLDYRGYGLSDGRPSEAGIYLDGQAGLDYMTSEMKVPLERIIIFGRSLGSAVTIHIAQEQDLAGLILVSPLSSGRDVAKHHGLGWLGPIIGRPFDSLSKVDKIRAPVLIIHGKRDRILPPSMGRSIHDRIQGKKRFLLIEHVGHNDITQLAAEEFFTSIENFMNEVAPEA